MLRASVNRPAHPSSHFAARCSPIRSSPSTCERLWPGGSRRCVGRENPPHSLGDRVGRDDAVGSARGNSGEMAMSGKSLRVAGAATLLLGGLIAAVVLAAPAPRVSGEPAGGLEETNEPIASPPAMSPAQAASDLVVHEWGTFLGMSGSDGSALDAMYHEEHALPAFVHGRARISSGCRSCCSRARRPSSISTRRGPSRSGSAWTSRRGSGRTGIRRRRWSVRRWRGRPRARITRGTAGSAGSPRWCRRPPCRPRHPRDQPRRALELRPRRQRGLRQDDEHGERDGAARVRAVPLLSRAGGGQAAPAPGPRAAGRSRWITSPGWASACGTSSCSGSRGAAGPTRIAPRCGRASRSAG